MRKVLSFVLVLTLVLSSFSMAFAATPATSAGLSDVAGNANEDAIQVTYDLGIVTGYEDGTFQPEKTVTRAEFAALITRALAIPDSALAGYSTTTFKDTVGYGWAIPYLAFCQSKGIMLGDGAGNVMPGRTINTNEAVAMILRAIGYTSNSAALVGTWPANYVTLAQDKDLYDDVVSTDDVTRATAAQVLYNALTLDKVEVSADGTTEVILDSSMLVTGLDCEAVDGIIDGDITNDGVINLEKYTAQYGTAYINDDDDIVAFSPDSTSVEGTWESDTDYNFDAYLDSDKEYEISNSANEYNHPDNDFTSSTAVLYFENGVDVGTIALKDLTVSDVVYTFNGDISGKTINELYSISCWTVDDDDMVSKDDIASINDDQELLGLDFATDDEDNIDLNSFKLIGVSSLDKIAEGNVVYVYADDDDEIDKVAVGTEQVTGTVTKKTSDSIYVGGTEYDWAIYNIAGISNNGDDSDIAAGDDVILYLDAYGYIYDYDTEDSTPDTYGVVKDYEGAGVDDAKIKLYNSDGDTETYYIDDDVDITTGPVITADDIDFVNDGDIPNYSVIGYSLDNAGVIDELDGTAVTASAWVVKSESVLSVDGDSYPIADNVVVFTFDGVDDYDIISMADLEDTDNYTLRNTIVSVSAIIDPDDGVVALLVDDFDATGGSDDVYAVANDFDEAYDETLDDTVYNLIGFADGAAIDKNTDDDSYTGDVKTGINDINLYAISYDSDGYIDSINEVIDGVDDYAVTSGSIYDTLNDKTNLQLDSATGAWVEIADNAVVYEIADYGTGDKEYKLSSKGSLKASSAATTYHVYLYETDDDESGYDVVIWYK